MTTVIFGACAFLSALLLFLVEPVVGRMVLPLLGGSAAVWTTCLVVFQGLLLLGYAWSHATARLPARVEAGVQVAVLFTAAMTLPISLPAGWAPPLTANPQRQLVQLLLGVVGLPFFALATNAPTLQRWYARQPGRGDPYFLYGLSNAGSICGLVLYPAVFEPLLTVTQHRILWSVGFVVLLICVTACAVLYRASTGSRALDTPRSPATRAPGWKTVGRWVCLAFVPSSLTLGCTTYLSTELAPIPLLWVLPLGLYLSTFVLSFSGRVIRPGRPVQVIALLGLLIATLHIAGRGTNATGFLLHLGGLFLISSICHGRLADTRPAPDHLTAFYLWIAFGGVLGALFNGVAAPLLFHTALEYPLILILAPVAFAQGAALRVTAASFAPMAAIGAALLWIRATPVPHPSVAAIVPLGALALGLLRTPAIRMSACLVTALLFLGLSQRTADRAVFVDRSFYSVLRVVDNYEPGYRALIHGATVHGMQAYDPQASRRAVTYYTDDGPIGQVFSRLQPRLQNGTIGVVGLGVGELAVQARVGQDWSFYEIDPLVVSVAQQQFSYLRDAAVAPHVVLGDGRRSLGAAASGSLDLLVLDAFNSDAIPVHLLTLDAFRLYASRLRSGGLLAVHISNRFVDLVPVLSGVARAEGLCGLDQLDLGSQGRTDVAPRRPSHWVVLALSCDTLSPLLRDSLWTPLASTKTEVWSDERADLLSTLRWSNILMATTR